MRQGISDKWTQKEKKVARKAFDAAYEREMTGLLQTLRAKVGQMEDPREVWEIEDLLRERRKDVDSKYDYRYSQLIFVFARLVRERMLDEAELKGLHADKLEAIHLLAQAL